MLNPLSVTIKLNIKRQLQMVIFSMNALDKGEYTSV